MVRAPVFSLATCFGITDGRAQPAETRTYLEPHSPQKPYRMFVSSHHGHKSQEEGSSQQLYLHPDACKIHKFLG